jgi:hypothetical protein
MYASIIPEPESSESDWLMMHGRGIGGRKALMEVESHPRKTKTNTIPGLVSLIHWC